MARVDGAPCGSRVDDLTARVRRRRATRAAHEAAQTLALDERAAVRELVEHTLPWAAAALIPFIVFFESAALRNMVATYDAMAYARLFCIAVRGRVLRHRRDAITAIRYAGARRVDVGDGLHGHRPPERADAPGPRPVQDGLFTARVLRGIRCGPEPAAARRRLAHDGVHRALHAVHARAAAAPRGAAPRRRASGAFAVRGPPPLAGAAAEGRERALVVVAADAGGAERVVVAVFFEGCGVGGGVVGMFSGLSFSFSGAPEGGCEVGGSFVQKNARAAPRSTRKTHRNHPHAIDATSSWSRPASPHPTADHGERPSCDIFPSSPSQGGLGSARGQLHGPVAVRESKNAKKEGALRVRIAVLLCVPGSNG